MTSLFLFLFLCSHLDVDSLWKNRHWNKDLGTGHPRKHSEESEAGREETNEEGVTEWVTAVICGAQIHLKPSRDRNCSCKGWENGIIYPPTPVLIGWGMALQVLNPQYRLLCAQTKQASVAPILVGPQVRSKSQAADTDAWDGGCHCVTASVHCSWGELRDEQWGHGQSVISAIVE